MPAGRKEKGEVIHENYVPGRSATTWVRKGSKAQQRIRELGRESEKDLKTNDRGEFGPAFDNKVNRNVARQGGARRLADELVTGQNIYGGDYERTKYAK